MFYEKKRIYSREVSKRSCKNDMNPRKSDAFGGALHFLQPLFLYRQRGLFVILQPQHVR